MSRLDLLAELQGAAPAPPRELRERVRQIAAVVPEPRRRLTRRRAAVVLVPAVLAVAAAAVVLGRGGGSTRTVSEGGFAAKSAPAQTTLQAQVGAAGSARTLAPLPPSRGRLQDYDATLSLRVRNAAALSDATRRAVAIARSVGGFAAAVNVNAAGREGDATIRLRVPVTHVADALARLSALGTITAESTSVQDVQAGVNALDREIARLQRRLAERRAQPQTPSTTRKIAALTAQVQRLQRQRASTVRTARLATISLQLTTRTPSPPPKPAHHGPLHGAVVALEWLGIGALYALVVGGPIVVLGLALWLGIRLLRRRSERRLLERA